MEQLVASEAFLRVVKLAGGGGLDPQTIAKDPGRYMHLFGINPRLGRGRHALAAVEWPGVSLETNLPTRCPAVRTGQDLFRALPELGIPDLVAVIGVEPRVAVQETVFEKVGDRTLGLRRRGGERLVVLG